MDREYVLTIGYLIFWLSFIFAAVHLKRDNLVIGIVIVSWVIFLVLAALKLYQGKSIKKRS